MDKLISFCLTTFNKKEMLEITLENYFQHQKPEYEIIISDGCSTDGTIEYLQALKNEEKIDTLILSDKRDNGEWEGFKKTLDYVTGKYIYFLTDDDYFDFSTIEKIVYTLLYHKKVDYLIANGYDYSFNGVISLDYHSQLKKSNTTNISQNGLTNGVCGLGLFIKSELTNYLELFSPKFGKRTDKTVTLELLNSKFIGASTDAKTYVGIKNEKSNGYLYNCDWGNMENTQILNHDPDKTFIVNIDAFKQRFQDAKNIINNPFTLEFIVYDLKNS